MPNKRGTLKAVLSPAARSDVRDVLKWSETKFGHDARLRYEALIFQALRDIEADPVRPGSTERPEIMIEGVRTYQSVLAAHAPGLRWELFTSPVISSSTVTVRTRTRSKLAASFAMTVIWLVTFPRITVAGTCHDQD